MTKKIILLIILLTGLLLITPITAKEITSKVDDKHIQHSYGNDYYFIHTVVFGDIQVMEEVYDGIMINDTIKFYSNSKWGIWESVTVI